MFEKSAEKVKKISALSKRMTNWVITCKEANMSDDYPLTAFYRRYKAKEISARELEAKLFKHFLDSFDCKYGLYFASKSDKIDFLCWFYPVMRRAIDRYDDKTSSFDAYLATTLRFAYKSYRQKKKEHTAAENSYRETLDMELMLYEVDVEYADKAELLVDYRVEEPNHILLMLLKSYYYVSEEVLHKAASAIGIGHEILGKMVDTLHCLQFKKIEKLGRLIRYSHSLYYRCINYERQLIEKKESWPLCSLVSRRLEQGRRRLFNLRERIKSIRIEATNNDLSKVLGIPKGTIDSRWAQIKNKLANNELIL
jgi:DNA-directed RNA polymerase specialized sigma24 family protein